MNSETMHCNLPAASDIPKLTVIIPLRETGQIGAANRLGWRKHYDARSVEIIVVDDGTPSEHQTELHLATAAIGARLISLNTADAPFSLSRARNAGLRAARAPVVYFEDVDFLAPSNFYQRLITCRRYLDQVPFNFLAIPTLFLNEGTSASLMAAADFDAEFESLVARIGFINPDNENTLVDSFAPVGSNILVKRSTCFHVGLFDEYFNSWGGEDREFIFRLLNHNTHLLRPSEFPDTKKWKIHRTNIFSGWRALYRLHGNWAQNLGLFSAHVFHPAYAWKNQHYREANFRYCDSKIAAVHSGKIKTFPEPFQDGAPEPRHTVMIGRNPTFFNDDVMELLGSVSVIDMNYDEPPEQFADMVMRLNPTDVLFQNVYSNDWIRALWDVLQPMDVRTYCVERGALPGSIYFDKSGFCADSRSYEPARWQASEPVSAKQYVENLRQSGNALEPQGEASIDTVKTKLDPAKKTVLVLLQSLTDATTRYFTAPLPDYNAFFAVIQTLINGGKFNLLIKNHPLNKVLPISGGIDVSNANIYDLYEIADHCVTLNSGAGLLALGAGCSVVTLGTCFYAHPGLARHADGVEQLQAILSADPAHDASAVDRFFGYLINDFYSFATWKYGMRSQSASTNMSLMSDVRYSAIRIEELRVEIEHGQLDRFALIMDPYALDLYQRRRKDSLPSPPQRSKIVPAEAKNFRFSRKFRKLLRNPNAFFADAKFVFLRPLGRLFPDKNPSWR